MGGAFLKALKWSTIVVFMIGGLWGMYHASIISDFRFMMVSVLCFGAVYLVYRKWSDMPLKIMLSSMVLIGILGALAQPQYAPLFLYIGTGYELPFEGFFKTWAALVATIGTVLMTLIFWKFDDDGY